MKLCTHRAPHQRLQRLILNIALGLLCTGLVIESEAKPISSADGDGVDRAQVVNRLRWINQSVRRLRLRFNSEAPLKEREVVGFIQRAEIDVGLGQADSASLMIQKAINRAQISRLFSFPDLLSSFWNTLNESGLTMLSYHNLKRALQRSDHTRRVFQKLFLNYLQVGMYLDDQGFQSYSQKEVLSFWSIYRQLSQKLNQVPSTLMRYSVAKHLYLLGSFDQAESLINITAQDAQFTLRSTYLKGLVALERGALKQSYSLFAQIQNTLSKRQGKLDPKKSQPKAKERSVKRVLKDKQVQDPNHPSIIKSIRVIEYSREDKKAENLGGEGENPYGLSDELAKLYYELEDQRERSSDMGFRLPALAERGEVLDQLQSYFHIALARLALLNDAHYEAWQWYRLSPPGETSEYVQSLLESAYTLRVRKQYDRCAHLLDQIIARYPDSKPKVELSLWKAEMLVKAKAEETTRTQDKQVRVQEIYDRLESELKGAIFRLKELTKSGAKSRVRFPPEVLYWLPRSLGVRVESLEVDLKSQELKVKESSAIIQEIEKESQDGRYPAIEIALVELKKQREQLETLIKQLPQLFAQWRVKPVKDDPRRMVSESQGDVSQRRRAEASKYNDQDILQGAEQLLSRVQATIDEVLIRQRYLQKHLKRSVRSIKGDIRRATNKLNDLNRLLEASSIEAHGQAIKKVESLQAQLKLGPTLSEWWKKELESESVEEELEQRRQKFSAINQVYREEKSAPKLMELDILDPVFRPLIVDPLPDEGRQGRGRRRSSRYRGRRGRR